MYTDIHGQGLVAVVSIFAERYSRSVMVMVAVVAIVTDRYIRSLRGIVAVVAIVAERYTRVIAGNGCSGCDSCRDVYTVRVINLPLYER